MSLGHEALPAVTWSRFLPRAGTARPPHIHITVTTPSSSPSSSPSSPYSRLPGARALSFKKLQRDGARAAADRLLVQQTDTFSPTFEHSVGAELPVRRLLL